MNIIKIDRNNQVNGNGLRTVIWLAGCEHHCPFCQNPETWDPKQGTPMGEWVYEVLREQLSRKEIAGVTISGGEATFPANREEATSIMRWIKENYPTKTIWIYSGYVYEEIKDLPMMEYVDVLVDGPYVHGLNPGTGKLRWRGSANQRVIDVKKSKEEKKAVWLRDFMGNPINETEDISDFLLEMSLKACHN